MKHTEIYFELQDYELKEFTINVSSIWDYAELVLRVTRHFYDNLDKQKTSSRKLTKYLKISESRGGRCFIYIGDNKYISFVFPFHITKSDIWLRTTKVDQKVLSGVFSIICLHKANPNPLYSLFASNGNDEEPLNELCYYILDTILTTEPGYVRHDFDTKGQNGHIHPLSHLDINFSSEGSFKIGTYGMWSTREYERLFGKYEECYYANDYSDSSLRGKTFLKKLQKSKLKRFGAKRK